MFRIDLYLIEKVYPAKNFLYSLRKHKWIETHLKILRWRTCMYEYPKKNP